MDWMGGMISTLIRVIKKNKNSTKESREREREYSQFFCGKNMDWMKGWYQIYTNIMGRIRVKLKEKENDERKVIVK